MVHLENVSFDLNPLAFKKIKLNELQHQYLEVFKKEKTIEKTVLFFLKSGWLINFNQFYDLVRLLDSANGLSPSLSDINLSTSFAGLTDGKLAPGQSPLNFHQFCQWPFYRSLASPIQSLFWKNHEIVKFPAGTKLLKTGDRTRDLWTQISGQSAIYTTGLGLNRKLACIVDPKATFGEFGFFLDLPRTADVETISASQFIKIRYSPEVDDIVHKDVFEQLSTRFNVLRAIMHSPMFQKLPEPTIDKVIFSGKLVRVPMNKSIFMQGEKGSSCFFVIQGQVGIFKDGRLLSRLSQGSTLGEIALFWSQGLRTASAVAQSDTLLLEVQQKEFYTILANHIELASELESLAFDRGESDLDRKKRAA